MKSYKSLVRSTVNLAYPIILGQLGYVLMGLADVAMLGNYSSLDMSSGGLGNAVYYLFTLFGFGTLFSVSTLVSIAAGEKRSEQAVPILKSGIIVSLILSVVIMIANEAVISNIHILKQSDRMSEKATEYLSIVNWSVWPFLLFMCAKQVQDGLGNTKLAMYVTFLGLILNVFLNAGMIYGEYGFPEMGLKGAAYATLISRIFMAVLMLAFAWYHSSMQKLIRKGFEKHSYVKELFKLGIPAGLTFFFEAGAFSFAMVMAGQISEVHSAAHLVAIQLAAFTYMFVTGLSSAGNILVGNAYGEKNRHDVRRAGLVAVLLTLGIEALFALCFLIFSEELPPLLNNSPEVLVLTPSLMILAALFQISDGLQAVGTGILRGVKDTKTPGYIALISYWLLMTPAAYYLCFELKMDLNGIWISFIAGLSLAAILLLYRFNRITKVLKFEGI